MVVASVVDVVDGAVVMASEPVVESASVVVEVVGAVASLLEHPTVKIAVASAIAKQRLQVIADFSRLDC